MRRTLKKAISIAVLVATAALPQSVLSQAVSESAASADRQRELVERIEEAQSRSGRFSVELIKLFQALALLHREDEDHALAAAALERARQLVRTNYGLYSVEEALLLRQLIRVEEARGDAEAAWDLEQRLLALARRNAGDVRTVPVFRELAEKRLDVLERYLAGEFPPQIVLGCYYREWQNDPDTGLLTPTGCRAGNRRRAAANIRREALTYHAEAIEVLLRNELYSSEELRELEMELLRHGAGAWRSPCEGMKLGELLASDLLASCVAPVSRLGGSVAANMGAILVRLFIYEVRSSASLLSRITALVHVIDQQMMSHRGSAAESAVELYRLAYRQLEQEGVAQASIDELFSPATPVVLPALLPNPLVSEETSESTGFIDVAFDITRHGSSERVEILATTTNATHAAERVLVRLIARSRFRPRATAGKFADASRVVIRYYLH